VSRKWSNWYQNEVDKEIKELVPELSSRDTVKESKRSNQLFLEWMMKVAEQE